MDVVRARLNRPGENDNPTIDNFEPTRGHSNHFPNFPGGTLPPLVTIMRHAADECNLFRCDVPHTRKLVSPKKLATPEHLVLQN